MHHQVDASLFPRFLLPDHKSNFFKQDLSDGERVLVHNSGY